MLKISMLNLRGRLTPWSRVLSEARRPSSVRGLASVADNAGSNVPDMAPAGEVVYQALNPATEQVVAGPFPLHDSVQVHLALDRAHGAFRTLSELPIDRRCTALRHLADQLWEERLSHAETFALEMGKPIAAGIGEITQCCAVLRYYADNGPRLLADKIVDTDARKSYVTYQPLGPVLAVMPWNFPFWQFFRVAAPCLVAGNPVLLKHAPNVPLSALALEKLLGFHFGEGVVQSLFLDNDQTADVISDDRIAGVAFTGSTGGGRAVAIAAGGATKRCVLELGGSDPFIVLEDADLDLAVKNGVFSRLRNGGQSCTSAKRFIVHRSLIEEFTQRMADDFSNVVMGDPFVDGTEIGPMARHDLRMKLHGQVTQAIDAGGELVCGGRIPDRQGFFYPPSVLRVKEANPVLDQELFGPVAAVLEADNTDDALRLANDSRYGLGGAVFTRDLEKGEQFVRKLNSGITFVNRYVQPDVRLPVGGIKASGYGRECGEEGIREFINVKTVWVN